MVLDVPLTPDALAAATAALEQGASVRSAATAAGVHHEILRRHLARDPQLAKMAEKGRRRQAKLARRRERERARRAAGAAEQTTAQAPERGSPVGKPDPDRYAHRQPSDPTVGATRGGSRGRKIHREPEKGRVLVGALRALNGDHVARDGAGRQAPVAWLDQHDRSRDAVEVRLRDPDTGRELDYRCVPRSIARELVEMHGYEVL